MGVPIDDGSKRDLKGSLEMNALFLGERRPDDLKPSDLSDVFAPSPRNGSGDFRNERFRTNSGLVLAGLEISGEQTEGLYLDSEPSTVSAAMEREYQAARKEALASGPDRVARLKQALLNGGDYDTSDLHVVMIFGSDEERVELRALFTTPAAVARNQDLVLPHMQAALRGDEKAREFIEKNRIIIAENMPAWLEGPWQSESRARWRYLDLHGEAVTRYVKKLHSSVYPEYEGKWLLSLSETTQPADHRRSLFTYETGVKALQMVGEHLDRSFVGKRSAIFEVMKEEVEQDSRDLFSPSVIGKFYRSVAMRENRYIFAAHLIDDVCLALDLPLSDRGKRLLWMDTREQPWYVASHRAVVHGPKLCEALREQGLQGDELAAAFEDVALNKSKFRAFQKNAYQLTPETAGRNTQPQAPAVVLTQVEEPAAFEEILPTRSTRLEILAALESYQGNSSENSRNARLLAKLVSDSAEKFQDLMNAIYDKVAVPDLIDALRAQRPMSVLQAGKRSQTAQEIPEVAQSARVLARPLITIEEEREPAQFIYAKEASLAMRDGQIRHATAVALDRFAELPQLADRKKIQDTTDIWELRIHRQALRIYFCHAGEHRVIVLNVGKKVDQDRDIPKLQQIRDREVATLGR